MNWTALESEDQIEQIREESKSHPVLIFKHSNTCNISQMMLGRLDRNWDDTKAAALKPYVLDVRAHRALSQNVAALFDIQHESPQALVIRNGKAVHASSHMGIDFDNIASCQ